MPAADAVREELWALFGDFSSKYHECCRTAALIVKNELSKAGWYKDEEDVDRLITSRVKNPDDVPAKLDRQEERWVENLAELESAVTDVAGARVVVDTLLQATKLSWMLIECRRWRLAKDPEWNIARPSGYHAVCHLDVWVDLGSGEALQCEVQVRTRLQEAWGLWSHRVYEYERAAKKGPKPPESLIISLKDIGDRLARVDEDGQEAVEEFEQWLGSLPQEE